MNEQSSDQKCCSKKLTSFEFVVVVCLVLITFFIGSMWFKMASMCPVMKSGMKFCPFSTRQSAPAAMPSP